jgi:hypothetical protein
MTLGPTLSSYPQPYPHYLARTPWGITLTSPGRDVQYTGNLNEKRTALADPAGEAVRTAHQRRQMHVSISRLLDNPYEDMADPILKWADSRDELEQAFSLVHEEYLRAGYLKAPTPSRVFFNVHNLLPSSATLTIQSGQRVVATLSIVLDSERFGLPMDALYARELEGLRNRGRKVCELCTLAVAREFRPGRLILPLFRVMYWYTVRNRMDDICIMVNPKHVPFYKTLLLFEDFGGEKMYPRLTAPAVCLRVNVNAWKEKAKEAYKDFDPSCNVYEYFEADPDGNRELFVRLGRRCSINGFSALYFLAQEESILRSLAPTQLAYIRSFGQSSAA